MSHYRKATVTEAVRDFSELVNRVRYKGERYLLIKGSRPVASLEPPPGAHGFKLKELPGVLRALPPLDEKERREFEGDIRKSLKTLRPPRDRWVP